MKKLKDYVVKYPEYYLIVVMVLACYTPPFSINALGITAAAVFTFQIVFKLRFTGILIASLFFLFNFYLIFALVDELQNFSAVNTAAIQLGVVGLLIIGVNLTMSALMIAKYLPVNKDQVSEAAG